MSLSETLYTNELLDCCDNHEKDVKILNEEIDIMKSIYSTFQTDQYQENEYLMKLRNFITLQKTYINTPYYEECEIMNIILTYINQGSVNKQNAMICLDVLIYYLDEKNLLNAIELGLLEVIKNLLDHQGEDSKAGFAYLANLCYNSNLDDIILENFDIYALIPFLTIEPNNESFSIIINLLINLIPEFTIDFFVALVDHFSIFNIEKLPTEHLCKILELLYLITLQRPNDLNDILKDSEFIQKLLTIDIVHTNNSAENTKRNQNMILLFTSLDIDISISNLISFLNNSAFQEIHTHILHRINEQIQQNMEDLHVFIDNKGLEIVLNILENGNYNIKKESIIALTAILMSYEDKTSILHIISQEHVSLILDLLDPEENNQLYIGCYIGLLLGLINAEHQIGESKILQLLIDFDISNYLLELKNTKLIEEYIRTFETIFNDICKENGFNSD